MRRDHLLIASLFLLFCSLPAGCGSGGGPKIDPSAIPAACSEDQYRPNYCGDVEKLYRFAEPVITYRIMGAGAGAGAGAATDIYTTPIPAVDATPEQSASIREGFAKWQAALGTRRQIVEVASTEPSLIDVVVQTPAYFNTSGVVTEQLGATATFINDVERATFGRAVVRIRSDLEERRFRYVILHEQGHALGLDGHSRHFGDVMYPVSLPVTPIVELSQYDRNTIAALYEGR